MIKQGGKVIFRPHVFGESPITTKRYYRLKYPGAEIYEVPCGHCAICKQNRLATWNRCLLAELLTVDCASFYTLTFNDDNLPSTFEEAKHLVQKFIKRLRARNLRFKYFIVSELGDKFGRLHFHALFFGLPPALAEIKEQWCYGFIDSKICSVAAIHYCVDYMLKQGGLCLYSKGLGYSYFDSNTKVHKLVDEYGSSVILPRKYYRNKFWPEELQLRFQEENANSQFFSQSELEIINANTFAKMKRKGQL